MPNIEKKLIDPEEQFSTAKKLKQISENLRTQTPELDENSLNKSLGPIGSVIASMAVEANKRINKEVKTIADNLEESAINFEQATMKIVDADEALARKQQIN